MQNRSKKNNHNRARGIACGFAVCGMIALVAMLPIMRDPSQLFAAEAIPEEELEQYQKDKEEGKKTTSSSSAVQKKHAYEILKPLTEEDEKKSEDVLTSGGAMTLYSSDTTEEEYLAKAKEQDKIFEEYTNIGIANVSDTLNIRKSPDTKGTLVGRLPSNAVCNIESEEGDWSYITSGEVEGYVKTEYRPGGQEARAGCHPDQGDRACRRGQPHRPHGSG